MKITKKEKREIVLRYFKRNRLMTLGTASGNKPWAATVFFSYDDRCNVYFFSRADTKHSKHIENNPYVSVVMNQDHGPLGYPRGLQMVGKASQVITRDLPQSYALYRKRFSWADEFLSSHTLYIVKPLEIHYIDQKRFGHFHRVRMI